MRYADAPRPFALVHRGGGSLAPENTLEAFGLAAALGHRYVETDVRVTADGVLVCFHDATLDRVTDGAGPLSRATWAQVRGLRVAAPPGSVTGGAGARVAPLAEVLAAYPALCLSIDLKEAAALDPLLALLRRPGVAERVCVAGAWDGWLGRVRREAPLGATALGWRALTALIACARAGRRPPRALATGAYVHVPVRLGGYPVLDDRVVAAAHDLGLRVVAWTVDGSAAAHDLYDRGVDAVVTDRPDTLREVLVARGAWAPLSRRADPSHA